MWAQEIVVGDPQGKVIVGTVDAVETICRPVRSFIGTVQPFDHLLERPEFFGNGIVVGKSNDLGNVKVERFAEPVEELLGGEGICTVSVSNKSEVIRKLFKVLECHAHSEDTRPDTTTSGGLVADNGAFGSVHNKPDVGFYTADFDVGFISSEGTAGLVIVMVNKRLDTNGGGLAVVGDLLVGDLDVIQVFQCPGGLAEREIEVDMQGEAE